MQKQFLQQIQAQLGLTLGQPIGLMGTGLVLSGATIVLAAAIAQASALQWQYDPNSAALSISLPPGTAPRYFLAAQPARIVIDLPNTDVGAVQTEKQFPGAVQQIRVAQFQPGVARIVMQLAPGTVLAPQQVSLQQNGNQWVLRPMLADAGFAASQTIAAASPPAAPPIPPAANAVPAVEPAAMPASSTPIAPASPIAASSAASVPPLEPGATEIPVELPPAETTAAAAPTVSVPALSETTAAETTAAETTAPETALSETALPETASNSAIAPAPAVASPDAAPETSPSSAEMRSAEVQPAENTASSQPVQTNETPAEPTTALLPAELPPAILAPTGESTVSVPALNSPSQPTAPQRQIHSGTDSRSPAGSSFRQEVAAIEFGQPLPGAESTPARPPREPVRQESGTAAVAVNSAAGILLPAGTVLNLRYQGEETLRLANDYPLQEVLVVDRDVQNQAGEIIVPAGSQVIGRFETGSSGSEFIAQAISINGQNFLLNGRSDKLSGDRSVSSSNIMRNSAIGAVAGTLLGALTGVGLIAGILAGAGTSAATTYLTAPQPAVIEPDRIVEVRLLEDLRQPGFGIGG